ncbi:MAG TPA: LytTR family DNA-binding domain-containing protein [Thermoanaerobaculia bacterium]|jgi:two-component system LytT family response regulator
MRDKLRVVVADDERPARSLVIALLRTFDDVDLVGEAKDGTEAIEIIERVRPDLALLDLQMPGVDGIGVVRLLKKNAVPMIAFITAYDEYAVRAFEMNAVDYVLKPVEAGRLRETVSRAIDRLERADAGVAEKGMAAAVSAIESATPLRRIPVRNKSDIVLLDVSEISSAVSDGELLRLTTARGEKHTITYRLKDLEARLDPAQFIRLSRGTLANVGMIAKVTHMPGGTYQLTMNNGQRLYTSRYHSRSLRDRLLKL